MRFLKLLWAELFGRKSPELNGSNLFSNEYKAIAEFSKIVSLFEKSIIRVPVQNNNINQFLQVSRMANQLGIDVIASLDCYENDSSMMNRLVSIKNSASYVKHFELLNELPHMNDLYPGEKINSLKELLDKVNKYSDWIHANITGGKAISMAPYNNMDERSWGVWDDVTNTRILKELILYTVADIAAVHLYGNSFSKKLQLITLSDNIVKWNDEAKKNGYPKKIWITECGDSPWKNQVSYYNKLIKLFRNTIDPEKIILYRQCVKISTEQDNGFALETLDNNQKSPLYNKLIS